MAERKRTGAVVTVHDDLATLRECVNGNAHGMPRHRDALSRVEAEIARLEQERDEARSILEGSHARGYRDGVREEKARAEAEVARLKALLEVAATEGGAGMTISDEGMLPDDEWKLTLEKVEPHSLCCNECKQARESLARLRDGLRLIWDLPPGEHLNRARDIARALLADQGGAAKDAAPGVAASPTQSGASPEGNDGEPGAATIGGAA